MKKYIINMPILIGLLIMSNQITAQLNLEWEKNYGGFNHEYCSYNSIQQTTDGGYVIAGSSESSNADVGENNGFSDYWIIKLDIMGEIEWENNFGGSGYDYAYSIQQTTDGGFIIAGSSSSNDGDVSGNIGLADYWIIKLDILGELEWEKNFGGSKHDAASSVQQTFDGGFIVAGHSQSQDGDVGGNEGNYDYWIIKLDIMGEIEWENNFGGSDTEIALGIQQTTDNGYIIVGHTRSNDGEVSSNYGLEDYWIVKLDLVGQLEWAKSYGGSGIDYARSIQQTADSGFIIAGDSTSDDGDVGGNNGFSDYWIIKLDEMGDLVWEKNFGGPGLDFASSVIQTTEGGVIVAGASGDIGGDVTGSNGGAADYWILKLGITGELEWEKNYGGADVDLSLSIQPTTDGGYIIAGQSLSDDGDVAGNNGGYDYWIIKLEPLVTELQLVNYSPSFSVLPNPSKGEISITLDNLTESINLKIFDSVGRPLYIRNDISQNIAIENIPKGQYYIQMISSESSYTQKLVVH